MERTVVITNDGSSSIYLPELDEHYHSSHGAIQEAKHVFIENGLKAIDRAELSIFELGFGTGLNALLTLKEAANAGLKVNYHGLEAFPVKENHVQQLNYVNEIDPDLASVFSLMHAMPWEKKISLSDGFELTKIESRIQDFSGLDGEIDLIYFDAFGHRAQAEMWELSILAQMYELLKPGGILVTYAARGQFKRDLKSLGFTVESLQGPPGKREMTRAIK